MTDDAATIYVEITKPNQAIVTVAGFKIDDAAQCWLRATFGESHWGAISMEFADDGLRAVFTFPEGESWLTYRANIRYGIVYANRTLAGRKVEICESYNLQLRDSMKPPRMPSFAVR